MMPLFTQHLQHLIAAWATVRGAGRGEKVLRHPLRSRIHAAIQATPGILPQTLVSQLGSNRSTVRYHLSRMESAGLVRVVSSDKRAHLFLTNMEVREQDALAVLQRGRTWDLARQVTRRPGQPQCDLTQGLNMSRKILRKYVDRLLQMGLIEEVEDPPYLTYFPTQSLQAMVASWGPGARSLGNGLEAPPKEPQPPQPAEPPLTR